MTAKKENKKTKVPYLGEPAQSTKQKLAGAIRLTSGKIVTNLCIMQCNIIDACVADSLVDQKGAISTCIRPQPGSDSSIPPSLCFSICTPGHCNCICDCGPNLCVCVCQCDCACGCLCDCDCNCGSCDCACGSCDCACGSCDCACGSCDCACGSCDCACGSCDCDCGSCDCDCNAIQNKLQSIEDHLELIESQFKTRFGDFEIILRQIQKGISR